MTGTDQTDCPVCGAHAHFENKHPETDLYRCGTCSHCFSRNYSASDEEVYDDDYFYETHRNWFENPNLPLFDWIVQALRQAGPLKSVCDVGCGKGALLRYFARQDSEVELVGIDLTDNDPDPRITYIQADFLATQFDRTFDVVCSNNVIEHIPDCQTHVAALRDLCNADGRVVIMTINESSLVYLVARLLNRIGMSSAFQRLYSVHHKHHFSVRSLEALMEKNGMSVSIRRTHNLPMRSMDIPGATAVHRAVNKVILMGLFAMSHVVGGPLSQTIICTRAPSPDSSR